MCVLNAIISVILVERQKEITHKVEQEKKEWDHRCRDWSDTGIVKKGWQQTESGGSKEVFSPRAFRGRVVLLTP